MWTVETSTKRQELTYILIYVENLAQNSKSWYLSMITYYLYEKGLYF